VEKRLLDFHYSNLEFACGASLDKVRGGVTWMVLNFLFCYIPSNPGFFEVI